MTFRIIPTKEFIQDSKKIDSLSLKKVIRKMEEVSENPERHKRLRGPLSMFCRVRVDKLRVLFSYDIKKKELYPEKIVFKHKY